MRYFLKLLPVKANTDLHNDSLKGDMKLYLCTKDIQKGDKTYPFCSQEGEWDYCDSTTGWSNDPHTMINMKYHENEYNPFAYATSHGFGSKGMYVKVVCQINECFGKEFDSFDEIETCKLIHYSCRKYLDNKEYEAFKLFLETFDFENTDVNILKTILIITSSFKEHLILKYILVDIKNIFDKKLQILLLKQ